jgi:hypothetical protein
MSLCDHTSTAYRPCREGYLAILFPLDWQLAALKSSLMPVQQYLTLRGLTENDLL